MEETQNFLEFSSCVRRSLEKAAEKTINAQDFNRLAQLEAEVLQSDGSDSQIFPQNVRVFSLTLLKMKATRSFWIM